MTPRARPWSRVFDEFYCRECGGHEACRSRPRGFFERHMLPWLALQTVRCERCYHRVYALRTIPARERFQPGPKPSQSEPPGDSKPNSSVLSFRMIRDTVQ